MKKISKRLSKKIALLLMLSSVVGMQSAWADPETVTINNSEPYVTGITRGGGGCYKPDGTTEAHGNNPEVCGIRNTTNPDPGSGDYGAINSIVTNGEISTKNVHGVWMILGHNVTIDSLSGGITLQGTAGVTGIDVNSGNTYDTLTVSNMGNISATGSGSESKVYGISATKGTASIVGDATNKATISVAATSTYGSNNKAVAVYVSGTTLTLENFNLSTGSRTIGADANAALTVSAGDVANTVLNLKNTILGGKISAGTTNALQLNFKGTDSEWKLGGADSVTGTINASVESGGIVTLIAADTAIDAANAQALSAVIGGAGTVKFGNGTDSRYFKTSADNVKATTNQVADNTTLILTSGTLSNTLTKGTTNSAIWIGDGTNAAEVKATAALYTAVEPEIKTNGTLLLDSNTLSSMNSGDGAIKLNQDVTVADAVTITGILDANGKTLDMQQGTGVTPVYSTLTVGTLKGTATLKIDLDMSNTTNVDKLTVTDATGATVNLSSVNVRTDYVVGQGGSIPTDPLPNCVIYVDGTGANGATYQIAGKADGSITYTNTYKYKFTLGEAGKLNCQISVPDTAFKEMVEGTTDITLSLIEDMKYEGAVTGDSMTLGNNMKINLNNYNLDSDYASTVTNNNKTMSIDGGDGATPGGLGAKLTWIVAEGGTLNLSGKIKVDGTISGAGAVTNSNTGDLTIDAAKLAITNANGLVNDGTVTIGTGALGSVITGEGKTVINGAVTSDKKITQTQLNIAEGGSLDISVANFGVKNAVENKGALKLSGGGTIEVPITGTTGTTTFATGNTTVNSVIQTYINVDAGAGLTIKASDLGGAPENKGTLTLLDGKLSKNITSGQAGGQSKTIIDGDVTIDGGGIKQQDLTINEGKSLYVPDLGDLTIENKIDNKGTFCFNGQTLAVDKVTNASTATVKATGAGKVAAGAVTAGTLEFGNDVGDATNEYLTSFTNTTIKVSEHGSITLNRGTEAAGNAVVLTKKIEGDGTLKLLGTETYEIDADNLQIAKSEIATGGKLTLTAGTFVKAMEIAENAEVTLGTNATLGAGSKVTGAGKITGEIKFTGEGDEVTINADTFSNNKGLTVNVPKDKTLVLEDGKLTREVTVADGGTVKLAGAELGVAESGGECVTNGTLEFGKKDGEETRAYSVNADYIKTAAKAVDEGVTLAINGNGNDVLGGNISNKGTLQVKDVAEVQGEITNDGTMTIDKEGEIVVYGSIKKSEGAGDTELKINSGFVKFYGDTIENPVTIAQNATLDPKADVFKGDVTVEGRLIFGSMEPAEFDGGNLTANVTVSGTGTLTIKDSVKLAGGKLSFADGSTLELSLKRDDGSNPAFFAANEGAVTAATAAISNITAADQVAGIDKTKIQLTGKAENGGYYVVLSGTTVTGSEINKDMISYDDGEITAIELTKVGDALTIQTIKTTKAEENVNCFAGVQQGMISVTNQVTDAVADHLGLLSMNRVENGKYSKGVWASYIRNKDNSDGMNTLSSAADGSNAKGLGSNYTSQVNGVTVGADLFSSEKAVGGLAINYATGTTTGSGDGAILNNKTKYRGFEFYNRITNKHHAILMDIGYMRGNNEITAADKKNWTADADVNSITAGVRWERDFKLKGGSKLVPFAGLRYIRLQNKDFSNSKGLAYSTNNQNLYQPKLGVAWTGEYKMNKSDWTFKPKAEVGYLWALGNREAETSAQFKSYSAISKYDVTDKSSYYAKLGMEFKKSNFAAGVDYSYMKGNAVRSNKINVNLSWSF